MSIHRQEFSHHRLGPAMNPKSILATVDEIVQAHRSLSIPIDEGEFCEAWAILLRIEKRLGTFWLSESGEG